MSYGGHVLDMISRIRQNRELKEKHHDRFQKLTDAQGNSVYKKSIYRFKKERKLTEEEHVHFRAIASQINHRQRIRQIVAIIISLIIIGMLLLIIN